MNDGRSITLDVRYSNTPYSRTVQAAISTGAAASEVRVVAGVAAGQAVTLNKTPLYVSSTATKPATHKTGVYYFYDGILIRGRYRITNTKERCGKTPVGKNVTGWADAADCGVTQPAEQTEPQEAPPSPAAEVEETGSNITDYVESMAYTDNAADESDSINIVVDAQDEKWLGDWMPKKGATLHPRAMGHDWEKPGDERVMDCGLFVVDDIAYNDTPTTLQLGGVSKPTDSDFGEQERTTTWRNTSIKRIGETIAKRYGLGFSFDGEDQGIECDEQNGTDSSYYNELCKGYGLVLKVYARRLWVYDREAYKAKPAVAIIDRTDIVRGTFSWTTALTGAYTGGTLDYTDPDTDSDISCSVGGGSHIKALNRRATSVHDAAVQLCAALNNANHGETKVKFRLPGNWDISAANNITLTGYRKLDGKYFVDRVTHKIDKTGYTTEIEASAVVEGFHPWDVGGSIRYNSSEMGARVAKEATAPAKSAASAATGTQAGDVVTLSGAPLYVSSTAKERAGTKSGTYYYYDGVLVNGRYRITNTKERCGKLPVGKNVTGWVPAKYCIPQGDGEAAIM